MGNSFTQKATRVLDTIETKCGLSMAPASQDEPPSSSVIEYMGIWDTGASGSVISQKIVNDLGLKPISMVKVQIAGGVHNHEVFRVNVHLPNQVIFPNIRVTKADLGPNTHLLIGMDIIRRSDFAITNRNGSTWFSFRSPSNAAIDFSDTP